MLLQLSNEKKLFPIFLHMQPVATMPRFDTLMMVNGSIAALSAISKQLLGKAALAMDEIYPGPQQMRDKLFTEIDSAFSRGEQPVVFCSVLSYNAGESLALLKEVKRIYGAKVRTGVGGQLIRINPDAFLRYDFLDYVSVGDAEVTLQPLLIGGRRFASKYMKLTRKRHYVSPDYSNYYGIRERLDEMSACKELAPFLNIRQLVDESVRSCAWAYLHGICDFCSLVNINLIPSWRPFEQHFAATRRLIEEYGINWIFDVSNQWLPAYGAKGVRWLEKYLQALEKSGLPAINRYCYATSNSFTPRTAPLLRQAGMRVAYVGLDGWDPDTRKALGKSQSVDVALRSAAENDIMLRGGFVIGSGATQNNLAELPRYMKAVLQSYGRNILTCSGYLEIILPGSPVWNRFREQAVQENWKDALAVYASFDQLGYSSYDQECELTRLYINHTQEVSYEDCVRAQSELFKVVEEHGTTRAVIWGNDRD